MILTSVFIERSRKGGRSRERNGEGRRLINEIEACHAPFRASRDIGLHAARVNEKGVKLSGY